MFAAASNTIAPTKAVTRYMTHPASVVRKPVTLPIALPIRPPITPTMIFQNMPIELSRLITMLASQPAMPPRMIVAIHPISRSSCSSHPVCAPLPTGATRMRSLRPAIGWWRTACWRTGGGFPPAGSVLELPLVEVAIMLDAGHPQALHARAVDRALPAGELLEREVIALENLVDRQQPAVDRGHDFGLAAHDPTLGRRRRQVGDR